MQHFYNIFSHVDCIVQEEWKNRTLEECAQDQNDKECWPRTGDKVDHQVVRSYTKMPWSAINCFDSFTVLLLWECIILLRIWLFRGSSQGQRKHCQVLPCCWNIGEVGVDKSTFFFPFLRKLEQCFHRLEETLQLVEANYAPFMQGLYSLYTGPIPLKILNTSSRSVQKNENWTRPSETPLHCRGCAIVI